MGYQNLFFSFGPTKENILFQSFALVKLLNFEGWLKQESIHEAKEIFSFIEDENHSLYHCKAHRSFRDEYRIYE